MPLYMDVGADTHRPADVLKMLILFRRLRKLRDVCLAVPLISRLRCSGSLPYRLHIGTLGRSTFSLIQHVCYPTMVPLSDRRDNTWSSRGNGATVGPE